MRVVFMGTPDFAVPCLVALVAAGHSVPLVVTQPDRPKGRGRQLAPTPVRAAAMELGLEVFQPERPNRDESVARIAGSLLRARATFEARYIAEVLRQQNGNVSRAARALGLSRVMLQRKMKTYGLRSS